MQILRSKVTSKGQVTLPKHLRDTLGIHEGDHIEFALEAPNNVSIRKLAVNGASAGALKHLAKDKALTLEEMDEAIRERIGRKYKALQRKE